MTDVVKVFLEAGSAALEVISADDVAARWEEDSILEGYRVGGLAAHLARGLVTVDNYLASTPPPEGVAVVDAPGYFATVLADHDPLDSDFHAQVRQRGELAAADGHQALVAATTAVLARLEEAVFDLDRRIAVLDGTAMTTGEYLQTRIVELTVHGVDLAASVRIAPPALDPAVWQLAARVITDVALLRNDPRSVALALARPNRTDRVVAF